jgi:hypothetical protein
MYLFCRTQFDCCPRQSCIPTNLLLSPVLTETISKWLNLAPPAGMAVLACVRWGSCTICPMIYAVARCWCCRRGSRRSRRRRHMFCFRYNPTVCALGSPLHGALDHVFCATAMCPSSARC